jgi:hypothetical protein
MIAECAMSSSARERKWARTTRAAKGEDGFFSLAYLKTRATVR